MTKNTFYLVCLTLLLGFGLTSCQCSRSMKCSSLSSSREACLQDDDFQPLTYPTCSGPSCQTTYCRPSLEQNACVLETDLVRSTCPRDSRIFVRASVPEDIATYKWAFDKLSPFAQTLAGKKISKSDFDQLTPQDGRTLCGAFPKESCELAWDEKTESAQCMTGPIDCAACNFVNPNFKCGAKNKCNGVICL